MRVLLAEIKEIARRSLRRMFIPESCVFAFTLRRVEGRIRREGTSLRYTAMALIGLANEPPDAVADILHGLSADVVLDRLSLRLAHQSNMGDVAVALWAAAAMSHPCSARLLALLHDHHPASNRHSTVEQAWALTALSANPDAVRDQALTDSLADSLIRSFNPRSAVFSHRPAGALASPFRAHVACFADLVYPTIALAQFADRADDDRALRIASACADRIRAFQGPAGQWWWHYDRRTGRAIEGYPVYSVHQDAMAPMALFAVADIDGSDPTDAVAHGIQWLSHSPEIDKSLVDTEADLIWRKVARREPNKLSRSAHAAMSAVRPGWRMPGLDALCPPTRIDLESRPYHMGWILHTWTPSRIKQFMSRWEGEAHDRVDATMAHAPSF